MSVSSTTNSTTSVRSANSHAQIEQTQHERLGVSRRRLTVIAVGCFVCGTLGAMIANNWRSLVDLYIEANLVRYEAMTSELTGPADYWVFHSNLDDVRQLVNAEDAITHLEPTSLETLVVLTFSSARAPAVSRLREHPSIKAIMSTSIPLFCH